LLALELDSRVASPTPGHDGHNFHRFLAIDPLWLDEQGVIHARVSRDTDESAPRVTADE
jgi:hypothetical protein